MSTTPAPRIVARVLAGVLGSWLFTAGLISLGIMLLVRLGVVYSDARTFMFLLGVVSLLTAFLWAFGARRLGRVWLVLGGGGLAMAGAGWWLAQVAH